MVESQPGWFGDKDFPAHTVGGNVRRSFFGRTIDVCGNKLAMPVKLFRTVCVVINIYDGALSFLEAKEGTGELTIVGGRGNDMLGCHFDQADADTEGVVGGFVEVPGSGGRGL